MKRVDMRAFVGFCLFLMALIVGVIAGLYAFRIPLAERVLVSALSRAGFEDPQLRVEFLNLNKFRVENISLGPDGERSGLTLDLVEVTYNWRRLLNGRVEKVAIGPGDVRLLAKDGAFRLAGATITADPASPQNESALDFSSLKAPFDALTIAPIKVAVFDDNADGEAYREIMAKGRLSGELRPDQGGAFDISASASNFSYGPVIIEDGAGDLKLDFDTGGDVSLSGLFEVSALSVGEGEQRGILREAVIEANGEGRDWRAVFSDNHMQADEIIGGLRLDWVQGHVLAAETPLFAAAAAQEAALFSVKPIERVDMQGGLMLSYASGDFLAKLLDDAPLRVTTPRGGDVQIAPRVGKDGDASPLFVRTRAEPLKPIFGGMFVMDTAGVKGNASLYGQWHDGDVDADLSFDLQSPMFDAAGAIVKDFAMAAPLKVSYSSVDQRLSILAKEDACIKIDKAKFTYAGQSGSLKGAGICPTDAAFFSFDQAQNGAGAFAARFSSDAFSYQLADFIASGSSPIVEVKGDYQLGEAPSALFQGDIQGGQVSINNVLLSEQASGNFQGALAGGDLKAFGELNKVILREKSDTPMASPVIGKADFRFKEQIFTAAYQVKTGAEFSLGGGAMTHNLKTSVGAADYKTGSLFFIPGGAQPDEIAPVLKGFISAAVGSIGAEADFAWGPSPQSKDEIVVTSSGKVDFNELSFRGPGVAVSRTSAINGALVFDSLTPLKTTQEQNVTIKAVDLGALILENGDVRFSLPGDNTLQLKSATFPWFGGVIGAYDSAVSLSDGRAQIVLRAEEVDLAALLDYTEIPGLSGEATLEGTLPIIFEKSVARIEDGRLEAVGPGVIRYQGQTTDAASATNDQVKFAFDILRDLKFEKLSADIEGPLDGNLKFQLFFEGTNDITPPDGQNIEIASAPVVYRISIDAPLLAILENAQQSTDYTKRIEQAKRLRGLN